MKLTDLVEDIFAGDKSDVRRRREREMRIARSTFIEPRGAMPPPPQQPAFQPSGHEHPEQPPVSPGIPKKPAKSKNFKFTFKEDKGSYQVKIKKNKEGKTKYNYGYYDREEVPDFSINSDALTDEGKDKYAEFKKFIKLMEKSNEHHTKT